MIKRVLHHSFSLLHVDHVLLDEKWNYNNVVSPYYRLYYIDKGEGLLSDINGTIKLEPGFIYMVPSFTVFSMSCPERLSQYFIQFFENSASGISLFAHSRSIIRLHATLHDINNFHRLLQINPGRGINRSDNPKIYEKEIFYREYEEYNNRQSTPAYLETQGILLQLVAGFMPSQPATCNEINVPEKVLDTIDHIQMNLKSELLVAGLANRVNINTDYFSRLFLKYTGLRPLNFIQSKRIERAQYLIVTTRMSFDEIAVETGFESTAYFSKVFKLHTGLTPKSYQVKNKLMSS